MTKFVTLTDGPDLYDGLLDSPLEDVFVEGLFGNDTIGGTDLDDTLLGNQDSDVITGRRGDDLVYGGQGDDTIADAFDNNILLGNIGADSITGGIDSDTIYGGPGNDTISGNSGPNLLLGNLDNDSITGGADEDTIYGGQGNDSISGASGNNLLLGNKGDDNITGGADDDTIYGGQGNDTISGDSGNNLLLGNIGDDNITGGEDADTIYGGQDDDSISGNGGNNLLLGNIGDDSITGGEDDDTIYGGQDMDSIVGNAGADLLLGNRGNDSISGGLGIDTIFGGAEDDSIFVFVEGALESGEEIDGGIGEDTLFVQANSSLEGVTLTSVENLVISDGIEVTSSLAQAQTFESISSASIGILQISDADATEITDSGLLDSVAANVTVIASDGTVVQDGMEPEIDNPDDPDKLRPIAYTLIVGRDDTDFEGRANAPLQETAIGTVHTLEDGDNLRGTGENDVLTATFSTNSNIPVPPQIQPILRDIETINISAFRAVGPASILVASQISGTNLYVSSDSNTNLTIEDLPEIPEEGFTFRNAFAGSSLEAVFRNSTLSATDDTVTVTLENVRSSDDAATVAVEGVITVRPLSGGNGVETVDVVSSTVDGIVDNVIEGFDFGSSTSTTTVNITGDQNLEIESNTIPSFANSLAAAESVTTINASNTELGVMTGDLVIGLAPDTDLNITGGDGNDSFRFGADELNDDDVVSGGVNEVADESNTVIALYNLADAVRLDLTNIQNVILAANAGVAKTINFGDSDDQISSLTLSNDLDDVGGINVADALTLEAFASVPSLTFEGTGVNEQQNLDLIVYTSTGASGNDDTLDVDINNQGVMISTDGPGATSHVFAGLTADAIENINVTIRDGDVTPFVGAGTIGSTTLSSLTITTDGNFDVTLAGINSNGTATSAGEVIDNLDFSGVAGSLDIQTPVIDLAKGATVTLSEGGSTFNATGSADNGTGNNGVDITGGAGTDNITDSAFEDVITGNGGDDAITLNADALTDRIVLNQTDRSVDTITGFAGDEIALSNAAYGSLPAGDIYTVVNAAAFVAATDNTINTILQGTEAQIEALAPADTNNIEFAVVTGANSNIFYSETGNFSDINSITNVVPLAELTAFAGFALGASTEIVPVA